MADSQWQTQFDYAKEQDALAQQNWQAQFDYGKEQDALAQKNWQTQFDYGKEQDVLAQQNWQTQFDYAKEQDVLAQQQWQAEFDEAIRQFNLKNGITTGTAGSTGGTDTGTGTGGKGDPETLALQKQLNAMGANIAEDGIWGNETKAAYEKYIGGSTELAEAHVRGMSAAGESRNKVMQYLDAQKALGNISKEKYAELMSAYAFAGR
jgi:hypothetical protein